MFEFGMRIKLAVLRLLVLACVGFGMAAGAGATPVTLRFEARVASIILRNGGSQHIPETVIGDSVSIVFSFNDPSVEINNPQQYSNCVTFVRQRICSTKLFNNSSGPS